MLNEIVEALQNNYGETLEQRILDEYIPADGLYMIVENGQNGFVLQQPVLIKYDKKERKLDETLQDLDFFRYADYYSSLIDMNKPVDKKKLIHSNNYLSFFVKMPNMIPPKGGGNSKLTQEVIADYYALLANPRAKYEKNKNSRIAYEKIESTLGKPDLEKISQIQSWIVEKIPFLAEKCTGAGYIKVFFRYGTETEWKEEYRREGQRYILPNLFNSNDSNVEIDGEINGLSNNNMGLNSKKPYLENKSRKSIAPYLITAEKALLQKYCMDWLMNKAVGGKVNVYLGDTVHVFGDREPPEFEADSFSGIFLRIRKGKELEILDFEIIPRYQTKLPNPFDYKDYLQLEDEELYVEYGLCERRKDLESLINEVVFEKRLTGCYFRESKEIKGGNPVLDRNLIECNGILFDWFHKGKAPESWKRLEQAVEEMLWKAVENGQLVKTRNRFNFLLSLRAYFEGGSEMGDTLVGNFNGLLAKIDAKEVCGIESDQEYFFAVGQLISVLYSKSKSGRGKAGLAQGFTKIKTDEGIKELITRLWEKYAYDIADEDVRIKNLTAMVLSYIPQREKTDQIQILAGYAGKSVIFAKKNQ